MHILLKNTCVCNISDNICLPRFRRLRSILISLPVWRLIWFLHRSQLFGHCSNISEVQGRDHMLLYMSPWHVGNIIALLFNRLLLIGSVSAWKISSLLIKLCIMGSRWSLWIGIRSHIKDHLIDLFSGSVQKALRLSIPYCLHHIWCFIFPFIFLSSEKNRAKSRDICRTYFTSINDPRTKL